MAAARGSDITGLILAGGRGSRMGGVDKGWAVLDGEPLVHMVLRRLAPQVGATLISANRTLGAYRALAEVVTDEQANLGLEPFPGPLAGVLAGLRAARTDWVVTVPCDAPGLPLNLVSRLAEGVGSPGLLAACASVNGRTQPVFALVARAAAPALAAFLHEGGRAMHGWLESIGAARVEFDDEEAFRNVNQLSDNSTPPLLRP